MTIMYQSSHVYTESTEYTKSASAEYTKPVADCRGMVVFDIFVAYLLVLTSASTMTTSRVSIEGERVNYS